MVLLAIHFNLFQISGNSFNKLAPILGIGFSSLIIGTLLSFLMGKKMTAPITNLSEAIKEVANGNFSVQIKHKLCGEPGELINHFNKMVKDLGSIEIMRNDFIVNVSHEFQTPIAAIQGYATLLEDDSITVEEKQEYVHMISESARRLSVLSTNILKLSKLDTQEIVVDKTDFFLDEQIRQSLLLLESAWSSKNIQLNIELQQKSYFGNEELLMQVWLNLLGNAIKFSHDRGVITISLSSYGNFLFVTIQDFGIGMDPDTKLRIFEKFYQGDKAHASEGNGLGLALVKRIVDLCHGHIRLESETGKGTTFTVTLPLETR
jgi:signal transduction histidine kinase